jgi:hypothetical protein
METLLRTAPCWALFAVAVAIAWPMWHYTREHTLFQRRAILESVTPEASLVRRWFWSGHVVSALQVFHALFWSTVLLALSALLTWPKWLLLAADAALFAAMIPIVRRHVATQVLASHVAIVARRWPLLWGNAVLLALGFFVIDFLIAGAPDTRGQSWSAVAENAFAAYAGNCNCVVAGMLVGFANVVDVLSWHAAQVLIPHLAQLELKVAAWCVVLLKAGVVGWTFTWFLLGASALAETAIRGAANTAARFERPKVFVFVVSAMAVPLFHLVSIMQGSGETPTLPPSVDRALAWTNPCRAEGRALKAMLPALRPDLVRARDDSLAAIDIQVDAAVNELFTDADKSIDAYLDWYFSVVGQYERLGGAIAGEFSKRMQTELEHKVLDTLEIEARATEKGRTIAAGVVERFAGLSHSMGTRIQEAGRVQPCLYDVIDKAALHALDRDRFNVSISAGAGVLAGLTTPLLVRTAAAAMAARIARQQGFRAATELAGKVAARRAGTITLTTAAAAACAPGGPLAIVCGAGAALVTWLAIDKLLIEIDEYRFRDEMRAELVQAVGDARQQLATEMKAQQHLLLGRLVAATARSMDRVFVPARDGL